MESPCDWINIILHTKDFLNCFISQHPDIIYTLLCLIIFCETGLVATPFLPGDSLLFTCGLLAKTHEGVLNVYLLSALLFAAAILGDNVNYFIGRKIGVKIFDIRFLSKIVKREYLARTELFFEKQIGRAHV